MPSTSPVAHPMAVVARRTGLSPDVIRAWERRYGAVSPGRGPDRRRLYSDSEVERLVLLRQVVAAGWPIGQVAGRSDGELSALASSVPGSGVGGTAGRTLSASLAVPDLAAPVGPVDAVGMDGGGEAGALLGTCLAAVERLDPESLRAGLESAAVALGRVRLLDELVGPLLHRIGDGTCTGRLRIAHEHLASAVLGPFLDGLHGAYVADEGAPCLVAATPSRHHHALGALLAAAAARAEGWRAIYLGPNLPAEELAAAVRQGGARVLALSLVYPAGDPAVAAELVRLGRSLRDTARVAAGGQAAASYAGPLADMGAELLTGLPHLRTFLHAV